MPTSLYTDSAGTWTIWNNNCTATSTSTADTIWTQWIDVDTTAATTITNCTVVNNTPQRVWVRWTTTYGSAGSTDAQDVQQVVAARLTPEQEAEARRREAEYRERQKIEAERYRVAKERAEGFLYEHLTDEQRAQLKRDKFFVVQGGKTGRRYRINAAGGVAGNVEEIDDAGVVRRMCAHIDHAANAPVFDHYLAQKLMLQYREDEFLKVANTHWRR